MSAATTFPLCKFFRLLVTWSIWDNLEAVILLDLSGWCRWSHWLGLSLDRNLGSLLLRLLWCFFWNRLGFRWFQLLWLYIHYLLFLLLLFLFYLLSLLFLLLLFLLSFLWRHFLFLYFYLTILFLLFLIQFRLSLVHRLFFLLFFNTPVILDLVFILFLLYLSDDGHFRLRDSWGLR